MTRQGLIELKYYKRGLDRQ